MSGNRYRTEASTLQYTAGFGKSEVRNTGFFELDGDKTAQRWDFHTMNPNIKLEYMGEKEINGADIPRADEVLPTTN